MKGFLHHAVPGLLGSFLTLCSIWPSASFSTVPSDSLFAHVEGRGAPTIVFANGLGDTLEVWSGVQPAIATECARTFAYNRAGYQGSPPASGTRDSATVVAELRAELRRRNITPPYVLVGHSLGGLYMQYFARAFPHEVSGVLLVDSTHWNQQLPKEPEPASPYGRRLVLLYMALITRRELADSERAGNQVKESPPARDVPTIVLSSTRALRGETPASRVAAARLQEDIVADFPAARHVRVEGSGHYIQKDRPDVVINAARELAGCAQLQVAQHEAGTPPA